MKKWTDFLNEDPSPEHTKRVMDSSQEELAINRARLGRRRFNWNLIGGLGLLAVAVAGFVHMVQNAVQTYSDFTTQARDQGETMSALAELSEPTDFDLVADLDVIENLDTLEQWNGVDV